MRREQPIHEQLQPVRLFHDDLRVFVQGGPLELAVEKLRSAARRASDKSWKQQDPQLPKSIWYLTDAQFLGFRVVRPLNAMSDEDQRRAFYYSLNIRSNGFRRQVWSLSNLWEPNHAAKMVWRDMPDAKN